MENDWEAPINQLIDQARQEVVNRKGAAAEALLRKAYAIVYDLLTPLHEKMIEILTRLSQSLTLQGKQGQADNIDSFIREMTANNKSALTDTHWK